MTKSTRPTTCAALAATSPAYVAARPLAVTCKRLPQHHGECRPTLHAPREAKPAQVKRTSRKGKTLDVAAILAAVESGALSAGDALSLIAAAKSRKPARKPAKVTPEASGNSGAEANSPLRFGMIGLSRTGFSGQVTKVVGDRVTLRNKATGESKVFLATTVTRVVAERKYAVA